MFVESIFDGFTNAINFILELLPDWSIDTSKFMSNFNIVIAYVKQANKIFPIDDLMLVMGIFSLFAVAMFTYYLVNRLINLVRGAG